jgi:hypothetical protein
VTNDPSSQGERQPVFSDTPSIAIEAASFLEYLSKSALHAAGDWRPDDKDALCQWAQLEFSLGRCKTAHKNEAEWTRIDRFYELYHDFRTAMPYTEAERAWLLPKVDDALGADEDEPEQINQLEGRIISAGIRQNVQGRELMRRWISWHREADEYAGQNTLGVARSALAGLIGLLEPQQSLPEAYLALMRERDAAAPNT